MNRRSYLAAVGGVGTAALAGCLGGGGGDDGGDNGGGNSQLEIDEHGFSSSGDGGTEFSATVLSNAEEEQSVTVEIDVNDGDSLIDQKSFRISVPPGETESGSAVLVGIESPDNVTSYTIRLSEGLFSDASVERDFSGDEFRERLDS